MSSFEIVGLPAAAFAPLFSLSDAELSRMHARRVLATANPGFPCRVSLSDAEIGDELLLLPYTHQPADSPYRASGPISCAREPGKRRSSPVLFPNTSLGDSSPCARMMAGIACWMRRCARAQKPLP